MDGIQLLRIQLAGPVDILVNNASIFPESTLADFTAEDLAANVQLHAMAPLALARAFAGQGIEGDIVNMVDSRITDYDRRHVAYHLSKRMLADLTKLMAIEFAPAVGAGVPTESRPWRNLSAPGRARGRTASSAGRRG